MRFTKEQVAYLEQLGFEKEKSNCYSKPDIFNGNDAVVKVGKDEFDIFHDADSYLDDLDRVNKGSCLLGKTWDETKKIIGDD